MTASVNFTRPSPQPPAPGPLTYLCPKATFKIPGSLDGLIAALLNPLANIGLPGPPLKLLPGVNRGLRQRQEHRARVATARGSPYASTAFGHQQGGNMGNSWDEMICIHELSLGTIPSYILTGILFGILTEGSRVLCPPVEIVNCMLYCISTVV